MFMLPHLSSRGASCSLSPAIANIRVHFQKSTLTRSISSSSFQSQLQTNINNRRFTKMALIPKTTPLPKTMSAVLIPKHGDASVLQYTTSQPLPTLQESQVLIKNTFIGINYIDTYFRTGLYGSPDALPLITGKEAAGEIISFHPSIDRSLLQYANLKEGTRVVYLGEHTYAEYTALPVDKLIPIPDEISTEKAAASLLQGLTALTLVKEAGGVQKELGLSQGKWTLVHAAAGGTGSNMVQVLKVLGAKVIGTAGGPEKCELVKSLGAQWVIDSKSEDLVERVKEITGGHGVDVIFDGVGKATFDKDLEMVARKGTIVVFGNAVGPVDPVNILRLGAKNVKLLRPVLFGYIATKEERDQYTTELFDLLKTGRLTVKIHEIYPLKDVARAHEDLEGRKTTGKLLLKV
ncbi:hypothetical protein V8F06_011608 [Rhypophila decipiens]